MTTPPTTPQAPLFDPAVHLTADGTPIEGDPTVFTELYCRCGGMHRQRDPVSLVMLMLSTFLTRHPWGDGTHGEVSKAQCVAARELARLDAFKAQDKADEYSPREYTNLDHTDDSPRPWPGHATMTSTLGGRTDG